MVADGQVVLQAEGLQHHAVPHREREPQLVIVGGWGWGELMSHVPLATMGTQKPWALGWVGLTHPLTCTLDCMLRGTRGYGCKQGHSSWAVCSSIHIREPIASPSLPHPIPTFPASHVPLTLALHPFLTTGSLLWKPGLPPPGPLPSCFFSQPAAAQAGMRAVGSSAAPQISLWVWPACSPAFLPFLHAQP